MDLNERALTLRTGGLRGEDDDSGARGGYQDGNYSGQRRCGGQPSVLGIFACCRVCL